jgi:hypothetical protein
VLEEAAVTTLAHLGERGFKESRAAEAFVALFTLRTAGPAPEHRVTAFRLVGPKSVVEKHRLLCQAIESIKGEVWGPGEATPAGSGGQMASTPSAVGGIRDER